MSPITAKTYTTEVICLRAYNFGEADKILHLYSPEHGRISAIAKGVKKQKSKLAGACELLNLSEVQLSKGKNLDLLCQYQPRESFTGIRSDLLKLAYGLLFAELVNLTAQEADSEQVFDGLKHYLKRLDQATEVETVPLGLEFQLSLLHTEGYHPVLDSCIFTGQALDSEALYSCFSPQLGGVTSPEQKRLYLSRSSVRAGEEWVNVSSTTLNVLSSLNRPEWTPGQFYKAQKFLQYYFKQIFEKNLHSYELVFNLFDMTMAQSEVTSTVLRNPA